MYFTYICNLKNILYNFTFIFYIFQWWKLGEKVLSPSLSQCPTKQKIKDLHPLVFPLRFLHSRPKNTRKFQKKVMKTLRESFCFPSFWLETPNLASFFFNIKWECGISPKFPVGFLPSSLWNFSQFPVAFPAHGISFMNTPPNCMEIILWDAFQS